MSPRVPRLRWDDPFRALDMLASLWSSTGMSLVSAGAAQAVAAPYRTLFTTLQQLLIGKEVTVRIGDHDVVLTVTSQTTLWLRPRTVITGQRRWTLPARTPAYRVPLPELPHGLRITDVSLAADCLQLSALLPEWRTELPLRYLESVITQLSQGALSFVWPPLRSGAD